MEFSEIKELMRLFGKSRLERIKIKEKDFEIEMKKGGSIPKTETTATAWQKTHGEENPVQTCTGQTHTEQK
jgi:acetyl-CoA carboxylase biotin carboxyl carrier protein